MHIFYYFVKDMRTGEKSIQVLDAFIGDIGKIVILGGRSYIVEDYTEEFETLDIPEDFNY